jgi:hypothetical protein
VTAEDFVTRLRGVRRIAGRRGEWMACCPAHDDTHASLHITAGDGCVLLFDFGARCPVNAICAAVGLRVSDLGRSRSRPRRLR